MNKNVVIKSKKQLELILSKLKFINNPNLNLEQYPTDPILASEILWRAYLSGDIKNKSVIDFGAGYGIFGIGSMLLGSMETIFIDIDPRFREIIKDNIKNIGIEDGNYKIIISDIFEINKIKGNTGFINPPFGIQSKLNPIKFIEKSMELVDTLYAIMPRKIIPELDIHYERLFDSNLIIKRIFWFHEKKNYSIPVTIIRIRN